MFPKKVCKLEITEDRYGEKTVQYPNCNKDIFLLPGECKSFEHCFETISTNKYKTKFAVGGYNEGSYIKLKSSLIIPKDTIVERKSGELYADKAYVYNQIKQDGSTIKWRGITYDNQNQSLLVLKIGGKVKLLRDSNFLLDNSAPIPFKQ
jgi:hypothetical protein